MKRNFGILILLFLAISFLSAQGSFAQEEKKGFVKVVWNKILNIIKHPIKEIIPGPPVKPEPKPEPALGEKGSASSALSEKELRERIKVSLEASPEAADFMPELKVTTDKDGNITEIRYNVSGVFMGIETLDKETLVKMYNRINIERVKMRTERIQKQLEVIRSSRNVQAPPRIYMPPASVKPPPEPPKVPSPPGAPRRR